MKRRTPPREPSAMVEATAIALCFNWPATAWTDDIPEDRREYWRGKARIALAAVLDHLREPSPAIVHAICNSIAEDGACLRCPAEIQPYPDVAPEKRGMPGCYHHARETLRRGIDAALSDCSDEAGAREGGR